MKLRLVHLIILFCLTAVSLSAQNHSLSFDGIDDDVYVEHSSSFNFSSGEMTIDLWIKLDQFPTDQASHMIFDKLNEPQNTGFDCLIANQTVDKFIAVRHFYNNISAEARIPLTQLPLNEFFHVAFVINSTTLKAYLNGQLIDQVAKPSNLIVGQGIQSLKIGNWKNSNAGRGFKGILDELRISNTARYSTNFSPTNEYSTDSYTVALYHFNEGNGTITYDASGNGNHGTINGASWSADIPIISPTPIITSQPQSETVIEEQSVSFTVTAACSGPLDFQWWSESGQWNDGDKNGRLSITKTSTSSTLTITNTNINEDNGNNFTCEVKNLDNYPEDGYWINSETVTLTILPKAPILSSPSNGSVTSDGTPYLNWGDVNGATAYDIQVDNNSNFSSPEINTSVVNSEYTPANNLGGYTYYWRVRAKSNDGTGNWSSTWYFRIAVTPVITTQPQNLIVYEGQSATFTVSASCVDPMDYQWWRHPYTGPESKIINISGRISGATTNQLTIYNVNGNDDDNTQYLCEVYNTVDHQNLWVNSNPAMLNVTSTLSLISPNGSENWQAGSNQYIRWSSSYVNDVKLEYSINNGNSWQTITSSTMSDGSYLWNIPNIQSSQCRVKISKVGDSNVNDISNTTFTIYQPVITINSPNGGENWIVGTSHNITWSSSYVSNVKIEYSIDNGSSWSLITNSTSSDGSYNWSVPNSTSSLCKMKISNVSSPNIYDITNSTFTISPAPNPVVILSSPNGGESWIVNNTEQIIWSSQDVNNINIQYSTNNGGNWQSIAANVPASNGSYNWKIPNTPSTSCLVKIFDASNSNVNDISNDKFGIYSEQLITASINADEIWYDDYYDGVELGAVDANGCSVNFGSIISYTWTINGDTVGFGVSPTIELPTGTNNLILTLKTDLGNEKQASKLISLYGGKLKTEGPILSAVSQLDNETLFISSTDDKIYRFDSTGTSSWNILTGGSIQSTICVSDEDNIYVGSSDTRLYSFDQYGVPQWDKAMGGVIVSSPSVGPNKSIYLGLTSGRMFSMSEDGNIQWSVQAGAAIISSPAISEDMIYFGCADKKVYAVSFEGKIQATFTAEDSILSSPALGKDGSVIIGANDGYLYKLDKNLNQIWKYYTLNKIKSSPVIDENGNIYVGSSSGFVYALTKDKELIWKYDAGTPVNGNPSLGPDGTIYIGCDDGKLLVLGRDGKLKWYLKTGDQIIAAALITQNKLVYIGGTDGNVYIMKDATIGLGKIAGELEFEWPTYKGNNKRTGFVGDATTEIKESSEEKPNKYTLTQNYPNPFNPTTEILYSIPNPSKVTLKVYDVLGKEVIELVNANQAAGNYRITLNAEQLTSGIYFYRLQANDYIETKKMILLR